MATKPGTVSTAAVTKADGSAVHSWEDASGQNIWEHAVQEDAEGRILVAAGETLAEAIRRRRKRREVNDYSQRNRRVVRDMLRYVYVLIDASNWMRQKDPVIPPGTRLEATIGLLQDFVQEYYDQNPLSHLGFLLLKNGEAEMLTPLSSSSKTHKLALKAVLQTALREGPNGGGEFSLQNGLEVAGRSLGHQPRHGSREIVVITAALSTCDPGHLLTDSLPRLKKANIRVSCFSLAAELYVCRKIAEETNGTMGVCLDKSHCREWLLGQCVPPPTKHSSEGAVCEMIQMGFPTRTVSEVAVAVHADRTKTLLSRTSYTCPQCLARNLELPTDCAVCGLKLVLAPHLARSFHHLFPVPPFTEVFVKQQLPPQEQPGKKRAKITGSSSDKVISSSAAAPMVTSSTILLESIKSDLLVTSQDDDMCCFACVRPLNMQSYESGSPLDSVKDSNEILRFQCPSCKQFFCMDCDTYLHETVHSCPGCQTLP